MLRSPAVHFLVIGALLFGLRSGLDEPALRAAVGSTIVVEAEDIERIRDEFRRTVGLSPNAAAFEYMIGRHVEAEMLYREALALGLDRGDDTVRWRLLEKMEFLGEASEGDDPEEVLEKAFGLGLQREDAVIRRTLIDKYAMLIRYANSEIPSEQELRAYYEGTTTRFAAPQTVSFAHAFFSVDKRGDRARRDASDALTVLQAREAPGAEGTTIGDPFVAGPVLARQSGRRVATAFGEDFAADVSTAPLGRWSGPYRSAYGYHLVLVSEREDGGRLPFESVRSQVRKTVAYEQREQRLREKIGELRARYVVDVRWGRLGPPPGWDGDS